MTATRKAGNRRRAKASHSWQASDLAELRALARRGMRAHEIGQVMHRTEGAIRKQAARTGVSLRHGLPKKVTPRKPRH